MPIYPVGKKKNGLQKYRVIAYKTVDGEKRRMEKTVYGKAAAREMEAALEDKLDAVPGEGDSTTLEDVYEEYMASSVGSVAETTLRTREHFMRDHVLPDLGAKQIQKINGAILVRWKAKIQQKELSHNTRRNIYGVFNGVLNYAVKAGYLQSNPLERIGNFRERLKPKKEMEYYTFKEFSAFSRAAKEYAAERETRLDSIGWDYYVFFNIAFWTGLRKGEIHALTWRDVADGRVSVTKSISQKIKGDDVLSGPKNLSSIRTIGMPDCLVTILNEHKERWSSAPGFSDDFHVCGGSRPLRDTSIENMNKRFAASAGVKKIRIHDFRHSHVSLLANAGVNIQEIARRLGHSDVQMTWGVYSHMYPAAAEHAVNVLNEIGTDGQPN